MRRRPFGPAGVPVPVIGLGTWDLEKADRRAAVAVLRRAADAGAAHWDTAEMYGAGRSEEVLGEALRGIRDRVFLASKVLPGNATRAGTVAACERSLRRLGTDRLDLYLLHWPGPHPLAETAAGMEDLVRAGKVLSWGVSNFDAALLEEMVRVAGPGRVACDQVLYHLEERAVEHSVLPACARHGIALVAYSPFGSGGPFPKGREGRRVLGEVAAARGAGPRQVALAWTVRREPLFTIPRTFTLAHALENAAAGDLELAEEEVARLDAAFPLGPEPPELPTI
jgi:diketogulonate reductase-like aldo/keto reductase